MAMRNEFFILSTRYLITTVKQVYLWYTIYLSVRYWKPVHTEWNYKTRKPLYSPLCSFFFTEDVLGVTSLLCWWPRPIPGGVMDSNVVFSQQTCTTFSAMPEDALNSTFHTRQGHNDPRKKWRTCKCEFNNIV